MSKPNCYTKAPASFVARLCDLTAAAIAQRLARDVEQLILQTDYKLLVPSEFVASAIAIFAKHGIGIDNAPSELLRLIQPVLMADAPGIGLLFGAIFSDRIEDIVPANPKVVNTSCTRLHPAVMEYLFRNMKFGLRSLWVDSMHFGNASLVALSQSAAAISLRRIICSANPFSDASAQAWSAFKNLEDVSISHCMNVAEATAKQICSLPSLTSLKVDIHTVPSVEILNFIAENTTANLYKFKIRLSEGFDVNLDPVFAEFFPVLARWHASDQLAHLSFSHPFSGPEQYRALFIQFPHLQKLSGWMLRLRDTFHDWESRMAELRSLRVYSDDQQEFRSQLKRIGSVVTPHLEHLSFNLTPDDPLRAASWDLSWLETMPNLTKLDCSFPLTCSVQPPSVWPPNLTRLDFVITERPSEANFDSLVAEVLKLTNLVSLALGPCDILKPERADAILSTLLQLDSLSLVPLNIAPAPPKPHQLLIAHPNLRDVSFDNKFFTWTPLSMPKLLEMYIPPEHSADFLARVVSSSSAQRPYLPNFRELHLDLPPVQANEDPTTTELVARGLEALSAIIPHIKNLTLSYEFDLSESHICSVAQFSRLTILNIQAGLVLTDAQGAALLAALPWLSKLTILGPCQFSSLSWLKHPRVDMLYLGPSSFTPVHGGNDPSSSGSASRLLIDNSTFPMLRYLDFGNVLNGITELCVKAIDSLEQIQFQPADLEQKTAIVIEDCPNLGSIEFFDFGPCSLRLKTLPALRALTLNGATLDCAESAVSSADLPALKRIELSPKLPLVQAEFEPIQEYFTQLVATFPTEQPVKLTITGIPQV